MDEIKILLGNAANNYNDNQIAVCLKMALNEIRSYCNREIDYELEQIAYQIAIIKLNRLNTEGLSSNSYSGFSENYINGYPDNIMRVLDRKRKIKVV